MPESDRLNSCSGWIDLEFVERERTPEQIIELGIQLHLAGLSLSNTKQYIDDLGVKRSRTAIHNWVQKADLQPTGNSASNQIALDETVIRINDERYWLYAAVNPQTNEFLHVRLFQARTTQLTVLFLCELRDKQQVKQATFLVDGAHHLNAALERLGLRFQTTHHGNWNAIERVFGEAKRRTPSFSNTFSCVEPPTAESWLQAFAVWWNRC
jgi:putative transposase